MNPVSEQRDFKSQAQHRVPHSSRSFQLLVLEPISSDIRQSLTLLEDHLEMSHMTCLVNLQSFLRQVLVHVIEPRHDIDEEITAEILEIIELLCQFHSLAVIDLAEDFDFAEFGVPVLEHAVDAARPFGVESIHVIWEDSHEIPELSHVDGFEFRPVGPESGPEVFHRGIASVMDSGLREDHRYNGRHPFEVIVVVVGYGGSRGVSERPLPEIVDELVHDDCDLSGRY